ncbi:glucosamine-6-phosphate deaminase [Acidisphaera sp. L21]|uniref:glucosamine-6-phosphate deaminase n=1 Tax=Acidisphaera sp. L21 TaxID=1641851 RepID=UPI00131AB4AA|nr:glucosamine-6-phosphate deaminase [Acidisphaera sp. L21]
MRAVQLCATIDELGTRAAAAGAAPNRAAIAAQGSARIILATGASQFATLAALVDTIDIDWSRVTIFHLDEYAGLSDVHPASFRRYLRSRFLDLLPNPPRFIAVEGDAFDPQAEIARLGELISQQPIDVCFAGIGENCHLAFNDPPADFETEASYLLVTLDEQCRRQQLGEGWFATLEDVPRLAISMGIRQIMRSRAIVLSVPDLRKAEAVLAAVQGPVSPNYPASILQQHPNTVLFVDAPAASLLR